MSQTTDRPQSQQSRTQSRQAVAMTVAGVDLVVINEPTSAVAEAYRSLRASIKFAGLLPPVRSILIGDAGTEGQHSEAAANLGTRGSRVADGSFGQQRAPLAAFAAERVGPIGRRQREDPGARPLPIAAVDQQLPGCARHDVVGQRCALGVARFVRQTVAHGQQTDVGVGGR